MALARGIAEVPAPDRAMACQAAFERAHVADKYRKRFGRLHPKWGNGSVMGFAMLAYKTRKQNDLSDPAYCDAFACALVALKTWRLSQSRRTCISKPPD
jgi:hypothetical protein